MLRTLLACALVFALGSAHALTIEQARAIAAGDSTESRIAALNAAVATSPDERTAAFIEALSEDAVKLAGTQVIVMDGDQGKDPVTGAPVTLPADADDVVKALLATGDAPEPPENPMSADRVRWEHIQRVYELCDHNVSETARRLGMHRRTLQRILAKRAPR